MRAQGWEVVTLDMRKYGWDQASQTRVVLEAIDEHGPFDVLIGSSFGGLATANAAAQRPEADLRLVLLAPAFGYPELVLETLGASAVEAWEKADEHAFHPPVGKSLWSFHGPSWKQRRPTHGPIFPTPRPFSTGPRMMSSRWRTANKPNATILT